MQERRAEMLEKFDKDGDGKLSDDERKDAGWEAFRREGSRD
jgi:Ca2+-binding EF-hand superfamily protein